MSSMVIFIIRLVPKPIPQTVTTRTIYPSGVWRYSAIVAPSLLAPFGLGRHERHVTPFSSFLIRFALHNELDIVSAAIPPDDSPAILHRNIIPCIRESLQEKTG